MKMSILKQATILLALAALASGCATVEKRVRRTQELATTLELEEGTLTVNSHAVTATSRITGGFDSDGVYRIHEYSLNYNNAMTGNSVTVEGRRARRD